MALIWSLLLLKDQQEDASAIYDGVRSGRESKLALQYYLGVAIHNLSWPKKALVLFCPSYSSLDMISPLQHCVSAGPSMS